MKKLTFSLRDTLFVVVVLVVTTMLSFVIHMYSTFNDNNIIALKMLAIMVIAAKTEGYFYGIFSAVLFPLMTNILFTYPYGAMNFSLKGYPLTFAAMFTIAFMTSTLMTKLKMHAYSAYIHEKRAKELLEQQHMMQLETEREVMRANLLRAISHDLRTPLTAISGSASALLETKFADKETAEKLTLNIREDCNWLIHMVENLLTITKINNGSNILKKTDELVEEVVAEACTRIRSTYPSAQLTVAVLEQMLIIPMDFTLIEQVLFNLIENSIKYAKADGRVEITVGTIEGSAFFEIRDHGVGIEESMLNQLFYKPIDDEDKTDNKRGMGIGLNICNSIVAAHGGEISARNAVDGGAVFTFYLPLSC